MRKKIYAVAAVLALLAIAAGLLLAVPSVRSRLTNKIDEWRVQLRYRFNPPQAEVFVPDQEVATVVAATMAAISQASLTPTPTLAQPTQGPQATQTPTLTPTPLPATVSLNGIRYMDQHGLWNYCAPATLAMALSYWGWQGDRTTTGPVLKPFEKDKNVMPYELQDYVTTQTNLTSALRYGGNLDLLKALVAAQYTVLIEKGIVIPDTATGRPGWVGHYEVVSGYDDARQVFITQDSYFKANYEVSYTDMLQEWRSFNYIFLVIYPPEQEADVMAILGPLADAAAAAQSALDQATAETAALQGVDQFFAAFNRGTSLVELADYAGAAAAYDQAFNLMAQMPEKDRPWRMMWYETGPYFAYYYSGRYQDVEDLATNTIDAAAEPYLEESFVWRARARIALGDNAGAIEDVKTSLEYHPGFGPSVELAQYLGINP